MPKQLTSRKSLFAFFALLTFILTATYFLLTSNLNSVSSRMESMVTSNITRLSTEARLQSLAHLIKYYDLLLTESARNYAYSTEEKWKQQYLLSEPLLAKLIEEAIEKGSQEDKALFNEMKDINQILVDIERKSFVLVEEGNAQAAVELLSSPEYVLYKNQYELFLLSFEESRSQTFLDSTLNTSQSVSDLFSKTEEVVNREKYLHTSIVFTLLSLFSLSVIAIFDNSIKPLAKITEYTTNLTLGKWNERIDTKQMGLFKKLAKNVNAVAQRAEQMTLGLESQLESSKNELTSTTSQLSQEKNIFEKVFAQSGIGMALVSLDGKFMKVNKSLCNMLGYTEEELLTKNFQDITHPDDLDEDLQKVEEIVQRKRDSYSIRKRYIHKNGTSVPIKLTVSVAKNNQKEPEFFISQIQNLSNE